MSVALDLEGPFKMSEVKMRIKALLYIVNGI
jgi:hypothetical protein